MPMEIHPARLAKLLNTPFHGSLRTSSGGRRQLMPGVVERHHLTDLRRMAGRSGRMTMPHAAHATVRLRLIPWWAEPNAVVLRLPVELQRGDRDTVAAFEVAAGTSRALEESSPPLRPARRWSGRQLPGVTRSGMAFPLTLEALTCAPAVGIVAAPSTLLPEHLGLEWNRVYRSC